jgi:hypothetical protein
MDRILRHRPHLFAMVAEKMEGEGEEQLVRRGQMRCAQPARRGFERQKHRLVVGKEQIGAVVELRGSWVALGQLQEGVEADQEAAETVIPIV